MMLRYFGKGLLVGAASVFAVGYILHRRNQLEPLLQRVDEGVKMGGVHVEETVEDIQQMGEEVQKEVRSRSRRGRKDTEKIVQNVKKLKNDLVGK